VQAKTISSWPTIARRCSQNPVAICSFATAIEAMTAKDVSKRENMGWPIAIALEKNPSQTISYRGIRAR
jgi:hypothetical protein